MNVVVLTGYLGKAPKVQKAKEGREYVKLRLAVNGEKKTVWIDVVAFDKLAKQVATLSKGQKVTVFGQLENSKQNRLVVIARKVEFLRPKKEAVLEVPADDDLPF